MREEFLPKSSQDRYSPLFLTKDALPSVSPSLVPGVVSPPLSESFGGVFIPEVRKPSGSLASKSPVENIYPGGQSHEDRPHREAWMPAIPQVGTYRYRGDDVEAVIPSDLQSSRQLSHRPLSKPRSYLVPEPYFGTRPISPLSRPPPAYASANYSSSPLLQAAPQLQNQATNAERPKKKYWCSICGGDYSLPQVLVRHVKDMHEPKESCSHCLSQGLSFTFSRGRPYVYRRHLTRQHPELVPPEVRQKGSRYAKESENLGSRQAQSANYVPPLTRAVLLQDMSY